MEPLAHSRRLEAPEAMVADAIAGGARLRMSGQRIGNQGWFYAPAILTEVPLTARIMNEEPFGPVAPMRPFASKDEAIAETNRLDYGLAGYAFTNSARLVAELSERIEVGMLTINHLGLTLPETPFGDVKDSGHGSEGGSEAIEPYLVSKFVTEFVQ